MNSIDHQSNYNRDNKHPVIYLKASRNTVVRDKRVKLGDCVEMFGSNKTLVHELNHEVLMVAEEEGNTVFSVLAVIEVLLKNHPGLEIVNLGETDFIVEYRQQVKKRKVWEIVKAVFVCLAVFFGAAFTIMTFNEDVSVAEVFDMVNELILGTKSSSRVIEITYSIGLVLGVIIFFNHFSRWKMDRDPTPLQIQIRLYEENVNKTIIENASREGKEKNSD